MWAQFAAAVSGDSIDGALLRPKVVHAKVGERTVTLDTYTSGGSIPISFTRMRDRYLKEHGFGFTVYRAGLFTPLGKLLGAQNIASGYAQFDRAFVIRASDESKVRALFANDEIRRLISAQPTIRFEAKDGQRGRRQRFPDGVDELYCSEAG